MARENKYIAIVEVDEDSALHEQWPFFGGCNNCISNPCVEDCAINKFPITRQEAIERMAKGMFVANWKGRYSWDNTDYPAKQHFIVWAEVALNALLEADK